MRGFWRMLSVFLLGGVLGTAFGVAVGIFRLSVRVSAAARGRATDRGRQGQAGRERNVHPRQSVRPDPLGPRQGQVYERAVFLEPDFEVGPGPAFHVYLVPKAGIRKNSDLGEAMFVDLGGLRAFKGSQRYAFRPAST